MGNVVNYLYFLFCFSEVRQGMIDMQTMFDLMNIESKIKVNSSN